MRILLTNDDGIYADGLYALYCELKKIAEVFVAAPDTEKSSVGHGITLTHPIWFKKVKHNGKFFGYGISGTPADCVKFATRILLKKKPDIVISGINLGGNDGCSVFYSGTVAGAREGAMMGIPSMAISLATFSNPDFRYGAKLGAKLTKSILKNKIPKGTFLNVNVPAVKSSKIKGIKVTRQCVSPIQGVFLKRKDPNLREYYWMSGHAPRIKKDVTIDTSALQQGYVSITPIHCDLTDYPSVEKIQGWKI